MWRRRTDLDVHRRSLRRQVLVIQPANDRPQALRSEHGDDGDDEAQQELAVVAQRDQVLVEGDDDAGPQDGPAEGATIIASRSMMRGKSKIVVEMPPL